MTHTHEHAHTPHIKKDINFKYNESLYILNERNINKFKYLNILNERFYLKKILAKKKCKAQCLMTEFK